ncbi:hypothetical protein [Chitinimonas taiwanensis]|uniref:hypothetical protein n=1 Tax=Chitinimonas taiwanensis TaxID=240412 RepID=UPI0035ADBFB4
MVYTLENDQLVRSERRSGKRESYALPATFPRLSWPTALAYDTRRHIVTLSSLGGEGFLYRFNARSGKWLDYRSLDNLDLNALSYDAKADRYMGWSSEGSLVFLSHAGQLQTSRRILDQLSGFAPAAGIPLHVADDVFEVNIVDFLVLETLRVFEPDLHETLFKERELILQERRFHGDGQRDLDKTAAERLLELVSEERRAIARNALIDLFPPLEWAFGGTHYADGFQSSWLAAKRVCSPRYFSRYFELQTSVGDISERRFVEFLRATKTADELTAAIAEIEADFLLPSLAARLDESVDRLPIENAAILLPGMFRIAQTLVGLEDADPFSSPWLSAWRATSWYLKRIPANLRGDLVLETLRQTKALSVAAILIHLNDPADHQEGRDDAFDPAFELDTVEAMKAEWLRIIRNRAASDDALISEPDLLSLLYRWRKYAGSLDEPREWITKAIQTDEAFASMATRMMSRGTSQSWNDRVATPVKRFNREVIEDFIGITLAKARCDAIDSASFPEHREALQTLHRSLEVWLGLRERDPLDF